MYLRKDDFTDIRTALNMEEGNATNVFKYWPTIKWSYNTIRNVNKCETFEDYKTKFQPSKTTRKVVDDEQPFEYAEIIDWLTHISKQQEEILATVEKRQIIF